MKIHPELEELHKHATCPENCKCDPNCILFVACPFLKGEESCFPCKHCLAWTGYGRNINKLKEEIINEKEKIRQKKNKE